MSFSALAEIIARMNHAELLKLYGYIVRQIARKCEKEVDCAHCNHNTQCPASRTDEKRTV